MKTRQLLYPLLLLLILAGLSACRDINDGLSPDNVKSVEIVSFEAEATFDLSARKDWKLYLGDVYYDAEINGNKLTGTINKGKGYRTRSNTGVTVFFYPEGYGRTRTNLPAIIEDQSTVEKFRNCDPLRISYGGKLDENITGMRFHHFNALVTFEIENLPDDAKVFIRQPDSQRIRPLRDENQSNAFKAIILPYHEYVTLEIETANGLLKEGVLRSARSRMNVSKGIGNSSIISFKASIDDNNKLTINDVTHGYMVRDWPVTQ